MLSLSKIMVLKNTRIKIHNLHLVHNTTQASTVRQMSRVLQRIIIPILNGLELDDKDVGDTILRCVLGLCVQAQIRKYSYLHALNRALFASV